MIRDITIKAVANGFVVGVGCQTFVFNSAAAVTRSLLEYLENPEAEEKRWMSEAINIRHTMIGAAAGTPMREEGNERSLSTQRAAVENRNYHRGIVTDSPATVTESNVPDPRNRLINLTTPADLR